MTLSGVALAPSASLSAIALSVTALAQRVRLASAVAPINWDEELARLTTARRAGGRPAPRFVHRPQADGEALARGLDAIARAIEGRSALADTVAARADEVALEARLAAAVGSGALRDLARARYRSSPDDDARAYQWAIAYREDEDPDETTTASDDERDPGSLVSQMRRAIGERRLPVRVVVRAGMAARAATGDGVVLVAAGQRLRPREVARTVTHELDGHVAPALLRRATTGPLAFREAGDADLEEGRALGCEHRAGLFDRSRRRELAFRHVAACLAHEGVGFHDIADRIDALGAATSASVRFAARATRGGGLGRERVYLPAYWRLSRAAVG